MKPINQLWKIVFSSFVAALLPALPLTADSVKPQDAVPVEIWSWGLTAGYSYNSYSADLRPLPSITTDIPTQAKADEGNFFFGAVFELPFSSVLSLQAKALYCKESPVITATSKGPLQLSGADVNGLLRHSLDLDLDNVRLELCAKVALPWRLSLLGGLYGGYNFSNKFHHKQIALSPEGAVFPGGEKAITYSYDTEVSAGYCSGFIFGAGYDFIRSRKNSLTFDLRYNIGMADIRNPFVADVYAVRAGLSFRFIVFSGDEAPEPEGLAAAH